MFSTTKTLLQLLEEEQARSELLQIKTTRLERELHVAKDFEDKFVVQTQQLSIKDAALLDLQTAFDRASAPGNDANVKELQKLLEDKVAEVGHLRLMGFQRGSELRDSREKLSKAESELSSSGRKYDEELGRQRGHLEYLLAVSRHIIQAQRRIFDFLQDEGSRDMLERSVGLSLNTLDQAETAMALIQRSLKPFIGDDRKAETVQGPKSSSIPGDAPRVHPPIESVQSFEKPYIVPQRREMSFRPSTKGDSNTLRVHPPIKSIQAIGKPYIIPQRREISFRPAMKVENLEASKNPARNQPVMDDCFTAPSPLAPTPAPKHQPKPQDEGSQLEPRLPTAGKVVDSGKPEPEPEPEPEQTFEDSTPAETSRRELQMNIKLLRNQLKDAVAGDWDNVRPYLDEKLRKCCVDFQTELHGCKAELSKVNEQLSNASTKLLRIEANAKAIREDNWALRRDLNALRSASESDAQKQKTSNAAKAKAKITPAEREMSRLKDRQSLHIPSTG